MLIGQGYEKKSNLEKDSVLDQFPPAFVTPLDRYAARHLVLKVEMSDKTSIYKNLNFTFSETLVNQDESTTIRIRRTNRFE